MSDNHKGKIGRCPLAIRDEVCRRLCDGQAGPQILAWLNAQPEVKAILEELFEGEPVTAQNLSEWRLGGYKKWRVRKDLIDRTKEIGEFGARLAATGNNLAGPQAIVTAQLMEILEDFDPAKLKDLMAKKPKTYIDLIAELSKLSVAEAGKARAKTAGKKAELDKERLALDRERFEVGTCELFLKWSKRKEAVAIVGNKSFDNTKKIAELRQLMFEGEISPPVPAQ